MNQNEYKAMKLVAKADYMKSINEEFCTIKEEIFNILDNTYNYDETMSIAAAFMKNVIKQGCLINAVSLRNQLMNGLKKINNNEYKQIYENEQGKLINSYRSNAAHNFEYQPNIEIQYDSKYIIEPKDALTESLQNILSWDDVTKTNLYQEHFNDISKTYSSQYNTQSSYIQPIIPNQNYYMQQPMMPMVPSYVQTTIPQQYNYVQQQDLQYQPVQNQYDYMPICF